MESETKAKVQMVRVEGDIYKAATELAEETGLPMSEVARQAMLAGMPTVRQAFAQLIEIRKKAKA